jgi:choline dehydrogenase-like flavoprotein
LRVHLPEAVAAGGAVYARARAQRILFDGKRASGVEAAQISNGAAVRFTVRAARVVAAAGALRTPGLLARSGVANPLLGKRLFLHPSAGCIAEFDRHIEPYRGPMQTAYSDAHNYRAGNYGVKVEAAPSHPASTALALPWRDRRHHMRAMANVRNCATLFALARDRDPGMIDLDDEASVRYTVSPFDAENLLAGLTGMFEIAFAAGAKRVTTLHNTPIAIERESWNAAARDALAARIRALGTASCRQPFFSSHQMGTAALGSDRRSSVVDSEGRVWGYENLLVADASLFPQSSGANPMLTIMALARRVAAANV